MFYKDSKKEKKVPLTNIIKHIAKNQCQNHKSMLKLKFISKSHKVFKDKNKRQYFKKLYKKWIKSNKREPKLINKNKQKLPNQPNLNLLITIMPQ